MQALIDELGGGLRLPGGRVDEQFVVQAQHDTCARGAPRARTVTAHVLNSSAAAPWMSAFRPYRPRAAARASDSVPALAIEMRRPP